MDNRFAERLRLVFDNATMAEIARRIDVPHATIRNYFHGRMPAPEVLIKIAEHSGVSLNWLLTGIGSMYVSAERKLDLDEVLEARIIEVVERILGQRGISVVEELGAIDEPPAFNVEAAISRLGDPHEVMSEWFEHEGRQYPRDFGLVFFRGWESFTQDERVDAIYDAKKVLDRTLRKK